MINFTSRRAIIWQGAAIIILGFSVYANSLNGKFLWDDKVFVVNNTYIRDWSKIINIFTENAGAGSSLQLSFFRPLQIFTYKLDYSFWGLKEFGYHNTNVLLHVLAALALYGFINTLFNNKPLSFLASILFVVHPVHSEAVAYIAGRADLLSALFMLSSLILYIRNLHSERIGIYILSLLVYVLAILSKENALVFPILLLFYHYAFGKKMNFRFFLSILLIILAYLLVRRTAVQIAYPVPIDIARRIPGFFVAVTDYLTILFFPNNLHVEYTNNLFRLTDPKALFGLAATLFLLVYSFIIRKHNKLTFFSIWWFFLALLPTTSVFPINAFYMSEHWLYFPSIGFFIIIANSLILLYKTQRLRFIGAGMIISMVSWYSFLAIKQNNYWKEPIPFYERILEYIQDSPRIYNNLGCEYSSIGEYKKAISCLKKAIAIDPYFAFAYINLGIACQYDNHPEEAINLYKKAIEINPNFVQAYYNLGIVYNDLGRKSEATESFSKAMEINPNFVQAYYNLGKIYNSLGNKQEAMAMFNKAIEIDPGFLPAYHQLAFFYKSASANEEALSLYKKAVANNLRYFDAYYGIANLYYDKGDEREAISLYNKAIGIDPNAVEAYVHLGSSYCVIGKYNAAITQFKKALKIDPNLAVAHNNLAVAYYYNRNYDLAIVHCNKAVELGYKVEPKFLEWLKTYQKQK